MLHGKADILHRARERFFDRERKAGHDLTITPEESELKESGDFRNAQADLMRNMDTEARAEMTKYLHNMAGELGLAGMSKEDKRKFEKTTFVLAPESKTETPKIPEPEKPEPQKHKAESWLRQIIQARVDVYLAKKRAQKAAWDQLAEKYGAVPDAELHR